ncbi:hypothetical protein [Lacticaseibacillus suibinensis]|uniref:hypothetical protein n=1 Tax=Lacticaseibacillus suibinensis TaxID=2486011 RepID=UPI0013DE56AC|nr:hypothetical protein [Lacticaseibacillus suibinensis]
MTKLLSSFTDEERALVEIYLQHTEEKSRDGLVTEMKKYRQFMKELNAKGLVKDTAVFDPTVGLYDGTIEKLVRLSDNDFSDLSGALGAD